ncbi:LysR family transcriptional regulator [Steroidobacter sp.]|uniref:LysR family transcriptional regulator n=1 Tax=Steroidobacter sp. TaxID=1978227 RepID=UPI001A4ED95C|nr:LysR family transcriptional regulator [Steroidobacter sp.]MBL8267449.1 LysR family transcriptional regulator [Steroidobacter sp.]
MATIIPGARGFDLNLLRMLVALDRTRHVSKAAELLDMSQSGFSSALARLRVHTGDALFVRGAGGMVPTPRAQKMIEAALNALTAVDEGVLAPAGFEPASAATEFHFAMSDLAEMVFLPRLLHHFQHIAPQTRVSSEALSEDAVAQALASGTVDLALGYFPELSTQVHFHQRLYQHTFACLVRRGHPLDRGRLTAKAFAQLGHVVVTSPARSGRLFDTWLQRQRIERRVVLRTPHHLSLPAIVESTDLIATVPLAVATRFADTSPLQVMPLPFKPPMFNVEQHWHRRLQSDARHRWLRQQVASLFNDRSDDWVALERRLYGGQLRKKAR